MLWNVIWPVSHGDSLRLPNAWKGCCTVAVAKAAEPICRELGTVMGARMFSDWLTDTELDANEGMMVRLVSATGGRAKARDKNPWLCAVCRLPLLKFRPGTGPLLLRTDIIVGPIERGRALQRSFVLADYQTVKYNCRLGSVAVGYS